VTVAALVLAAGSSSRLGRPKQLLPWGDTTLLGHVVEGIAAWPVDEVWVVLGANADEVLEAVDLGEAGVVVNEQPEEGMASSLRVGLDAIARRSRAEQVFIVMGDQPRIDPEVPARLLETVTHRLAVVPRYRYARSNPALVYRPLWERLMSLTGDTGAKGLFEAHPEWVEEVWFDRLPPRDVDTPTDYEELAPRRTP
jgi:molybdenum cofactor cytidylyltransferase